MRLEEITAGIHIDGLVPGRPVLVVGAQFHGADALEITYRDDRGTLGQAVLFRENEERITRHMAQGRPFDANAQDFRLAAEAQRIVLAGIHDPMLAVSTSDVQPLPHQIRAVYGELLPRTPLRFLLADDPGAGKTIMAGLYIKELILRDDVRRCMVVAPGGLVEQWQDELATKFGLNFDILSPGAEDAAPGATVFDRTPLLIARMDQLARNDMLLDQLEQAEFDLVVVDEAHRMSASWYGGELKASKRFQLGQLLSTRTRHLLLMTATPHNGKEEDFQTFLSLLDRDRFAGPGAKQAHPGTAQGFMRRMIKEDLLTFDGTALFPERRAETASYRLSPAELELYDMVTAYVRDGMNRAERLEGRRKNTVGFAMTVLQRRLASSPEAIYQSLRRRTDRLSRLRADLQDGIRDEPEPHMPEALLDDYDLDDFAADEIEQIEETLVDSATAAQTIAELDAEIGELRDLLERASALLASEQDVKWRELQGVLHSQVLQRADGGRRKIIVFTEHRDTLNYLERRITRETGRADAVVAIHGGVPRFRRRQITQEFTANPDVQILIATDAAGEGLNLQCANLMVNYDLPWNPNRIEQRFGRIHRIGQDKPCFLWNLVAEDTREGDVYLTLLEKISEQEIAYGGKIYNVLGTSLGGLNLSKVIRDAILYGEDPARVVERARVIDAGVSAGISEMLREHALATDTLRDADIAQLRRQMDEARSRRLQPHFIRDAFIESFRRLGGRIERREQDRWEVTHVPAVVRERSKYAAIARRYHRVAFDVERLSAPGLERAELLAPGHPLHDATLGAILERHRSTLERGAVLSSPLLREPALMVGVLSEVKDSTGQSVGRRFGYALVGSDGVARGAGPAPYLDWLPAEPEQADRARGLSELAAREKAGVTWIIANELPRFTEDVTSVRSLEYQRLKSKVRERLTQEINRLETEALKADQDTVAGKSVKVTPERLRRQAQDLAARKDARIERIEQQLRMAPVTPMVMTAALVVPEWWGHDDEATAGTYAVDMAARDEVDRRGVDLVLESERALGRQPTEMAHNNEGFDVLSLDTDGRPIWIEVKSRIAGAQAFHISRSQVLKAVNSRERFRLALVRVSTEDASGDEVRYIGDPFGGMEPVALNDFGVVGLDLNFKEWWERGQSAF